MIVKIVRAAIKDHDGRVYSVPKPGRHDTVIHLMATMGVQTPITGKQGFLTNQWQFVDRHEAKRIAAAANQLLPREAGKDELFSEDVW